MSWDVPATGITGFGDLASHRRLEGMSGYRQTLIIELGIFVILLAITHHGALSAAAVGAWIGFAVHSVLTYRRPATASRGGDD